MNALGYLRETASQTAGPYVHIGLIPKQAGFNLFEYNFGNNLVTPDVPGERVRIEGRVLDGTGAPCRDVLLELWQADGEGRYNHPADPRGTTRDPRFRGWGRTGTDFDSGLWFFDTVKPGPVPGRSGRGLMAPHVSLWLVARGINLGLSTRMYFSDETESNILDPVLRIVEHEKRRETLIGTRENRPDGPVYVFDIHLQGERETVFFDI